MRAEENEYLTRVGPGTPMGTLLRRYWMPVLLEHEVPGPNEPPVRVRVVGENFLVWRDADGELGLFDEFCMHRRVSLALARCEGDGLRCVFHGWKFDVHGNVVDMPNVAEDKRPKNLRAPVYPARLGGGMLWVYLGPRELEPEFPNYSFMQAPPDHSCAFRVIWNVNYVQGLESNLDSSHIGILHNNFAFFGERRERAAPDLRDVVVWDDNQPTIQVKSHAAGLYAIAIRDVELNAQRRRYARVHNFVMPFGTFVPAPLLNLHIPIDDETTMSFGIFFDTKPIDVEFCRSNLLLDASIAETIAPHVQRYLGTASNGWFQDRSVMDTSFSGLHNPISEDLATISSMGKITDREHESTVGSDIGVSRMRALLISAARALENGIEPQHPTAPESAKMVCGQGLVEADSQWPELVVV
jgi:nitrite reductase/ring-hydroxylating ferredoxin subunit